MKQGIVKSLLFSAVGISVGLLTDVSSAKAVDISGISNLDIDGTTYDINFIPDTYFNTFPNSGRTPTFLGDLDGANRASTAISDYLEDNNVSTINDASFSGPLFRQNSYYIPYELIEPSSTVRPILGAGSGLNWSRGGRGFLNPNEVVNYTVFKEVPEPLTILGSLTALGMGAMLKRKYNQFDLTSQEQN